MALSLKNPGHGGKEGADVKKGSEGFFGGSIWWRTVLATGIVRARQPVIQQMKTWAASSVLPARHRHPGHFNNRSSTYGTAYVAASAKCACSQRLAKASTLALQGNPEAFAVEGFTETFQPPAGTIDFGRRDRRYRRALFACGRRRSWKR